MAELVLRQGSEMELDAFIRGIPLLDDFDEVILGWGCGAVLCTLTAPNGAAELDARR